jgi:hypothetical protein
MVAGMRTRTVRHGAPVGNFHGSRADDPATDPHPYQASPALALSPTTRCQLTPTNHQGIVEHQPLHDRQDSALVDEC